jgi:hypothetical protein
MPGRLPTPASALPIDHDGFVAGDNGPIPSPERIGTLYVQQGPGRASRRIPVVRCGCGARVECHSHWASACACGAEYDRDGWRLMPRECWGEDTGERFHAGEGPDRALWSDFA